MKHQKQSKNTVIRARCDDSLKRSIEQVAAFQSLDAADIIRIACKNYVERFRTPQIGN